MHFEAARDLSCGVRRRGKILEIDLLQLSAPITSHSVGRKRKRQQSAAPVSAYVVGRSQSAGDQRSTSAQIPQVCVGATLSDIVAKVAINQRTNSILSLCKMLMIVHARTRPSLARFPFSPLLPSVCPLPPPTLAFSGTLAREHISSLLSRLEDLTARASSQVVKPLFRNAECFQK